MCVCVCFVLFCFILACPPDFATFYDKVLERTEETPGQMVLRRDET